MSFTEIAVKIFNRVDVRVADDILVMPLHGVYPALEVETIFYLVTLVWIVDWSVNIVRDMIIGNRLIENLYCYFCK